MGGGAGGGAGGGEGAPAGGGAGAAADKATTTEAATAVAETAVEADKATTAEAAATIAEATVEADTSDWAAAAVAEEAEAKQAAETTERMDVDEPVTCLHCFPVTGQKVPRSHTNDAGFCDGKWYETCNEMAQSGGRGKRQKSNK